MEVICKFGRVWCAYAYEDLRIYAVKSMNVLRFVTATAADVVNEGMSVYRK